MSIPKDPNLLIGYINTKLRDEYSSLDDLCKSLLIDQSQIEASLYSIDYHYDMGQNRFAPKL